MKESLPMSERVKMLQATIDELVVELTDMEKERDEALAKVEKLTHALDCARSVNKEHLCQFCGDKGNFWCNTCDARCPITGN